MQIERPALLTYSGAERDFSQKLLQIFMTTQLDCFGEMKEYEVDVKA